MVQDKLLGLVKCAKPFIMEEIMSIKDKLLINNLQKQLKEKDKLINYYKESFTRTDEEKKLLDDLSKLKEEYVSLIEELKKKKYEYENLIHEQKLISDAFRKRVNEIKIGI